MTPPSPEATNSPAAVTTAPGCPDPAAGVILSPRPWVGLAVLSLGAVPLGTALLPIRPLGGWALPLGAVVGVFGLFLLLQTWLLRLQFGDDALLVWRQDTLLRRFPYAEWLGWRLFWSPLPVLFYFRERRSIHLLPVLFDASALRQQLERHLSGL